MKDIKDGWAYDEYSGTIYSFEHFPLKQAEALADDRESVHVVETINFTLAEGGRKVHRNRYFAFKMSAAIALAARCEIDWQEVAEVIVGIRKATDDETDMFLRVSDYFYPQMPSAISKSQARQLPMAPPGEN